MIKLYTTSSGRETNLHPRSVAYLVAFDAIRSIDEELYWYRTTNLDPSKRGAYNKRSIYGRQLRIKGYLREMLRGSSWVVELTHDGSQLLSVLTRSEKASLIISCGWDAFYWCVIGKLSLEELPEFVASPTWKVKMLAEDALLKKLGKDPIDRGSSSSSSVSAFGQDTIAESIIMEWKHNPSVEGEIVFRHVRVRNP